MLLIWAIIQYFNGISRLSLIFGKRGHILRAVQFFVMKGCRGDWLLEFEALPRGSWDGLDSLFESLLHVKTKVSADREYRDLTFLDRWGMYVTPVDIGRCDRHSCLMPRVDTHRRVVHITALAIEDVIQLACQLLDLFACRFLLSCRLQLTDKIPVFMQVVDHWIVRKTLNSFLHVQVFVNGHFETTTHLLVIDLVFLPCKLFLLQVDNIQDLRAVV